MQLTTVVQLQTSNSEHAALVATLRTCNAACDRISETAFQSQSFRQYDLHFLVYHNVKAETNLNSNHVIRAIAKVAHAYKLDTKTLRTFEPLGAIELDKDLLTWKVEEHIVSVNTVCGRLKTEFPLLCLSEATPTRQTRSGGSALAERTVLPLSCRDRSRRHSP
jgi:putative transposase